MLNSLSRKLAYLLPRRIVYWAVIRAGVHACSGEWETQEVPALVLPDILKRWQHATPKSVHWRTRRHIQ